jgi:MFS family permease
VARIIDGASGGNVATAQAYIADITKPEERSKAMGMIGAAFGLGFIIGPAVGGILAKWSVHRTLAGMSIDIPEGHMPFYFVGLLCIVNAVMVQISLPESLTEARRSRAHTEQPISELFNHSDGAVFTTVSASYFVSLAAFSIMTAVFSLFGQVRFGLDAKHIGYIMAAIGVIGVIMQGGVLRRILPVFGEVKLARTGFVLLLISFILLPLASGMVSLLAVSCLIAFGNSLTQPTLNGLASRSVEASWQGRAMGLLQSAASLGRGTGPILGGWLLGLDRGDPAHYGRTPFWVAAALMILTLAISGGLRIPSRGVGAVQRGEADTEPAAEI